jgi:hypothetical protein
LAAGGPWQEEPDRNVQPPVCYSATEISARPRSVLTGLKHSRPKHVFADVLEVVPDDVLKDLERIQKDLVVSELAGLGWKRVSPTHSEGDGDGRHIGKPLDLMSAGVCDMCARICVRVCECMCAAKDSLKRSVLFQGSVQQ